MSEENIMPGETVNTGEVKDTAPTTGKDPNIKKPNVVQTDVKLPQIIGEQEQDVCKLIYFPKNKTLRKRRPRLIEYESSTGTVYRIAPYMEDGKWYIGAPRELAENLLAEIVVNWHLIFPDEIYFSKKIALGEYKDCIAKSKAKLVKAGKPIYK